jgi:3-hydroxy-3-methylglutaryl CoA synthase
MESINNHFSDIGIDSIGFYAPHLMFPLARLAEARNVDIQKYYQGLLTYEMRLPDFGEDIVSLGCKAAKNALIRSLTNSKSIDAVFVGTETITYAVKSVSNIIKDYLGLEKNCLTQDVYNACAAGTLAILNAYAMIESGIIQRALVVAVDISTYPLNSGGEPTQGSGAVALIISKNPRIARFGKYFGKVSGNINDFFRNAGEHTPIVFGKYSVEAYLELQMEAYLNLQSHLQPINADHYLLHAPYAKLPLKFIQKLFLEKWIPSKEFRSKILTINFPPTPCFDLNPEFGTLDESQILTPTMISAIDQLSEPKEIKEKIKNQIKAFIQHRILISLQVPSLFGNMYSAAVWAQLYFILETGAQENQVIYFGSYGSGATCISGYIQLVPGFQNFTRIPYTINQIIKEKKEITFEEYIQLRSKERRSKLSWIKIDTISNALTCGYAMDFCDHGCSLTNFNALKHCPQDHKGANRMFFPIIGIIMEQQAFIEGDLSPMKNGWRLIEGEYCIGSKVELDFRRWDIRTGIISNFETYTGPISWIPVYRTVEKSPYLHYLVDEEVLVEMGEIDTYVF